MNLAGTTGSTDVYPSSIGEIPGEIARFQWTGDEGGTILWRRGARFGGALETDFVDVWARTLRI